MELICRVYWDVALLHYGLFPVLGPLLAFLSARRFLPTRPLLALAAFLVVNLLFAYLNIAASNASQLLLFGRVGDDPGDVGLVFVSLPLHFVGFVSAAVAMLLVPGPPVR